MVAAFRTLVFYFFLALFTILWGLFMIVALPFFPFKKKHSLVQYWAKVIMFFCKVILGIRWNIIGLENIPKEACVIMSNHQSTLETFFFQSLISPQTQVIKKSLLHIPFYGWAFRMVNPIPIDRGNPKQALKYVLRKGIENLQKGVSVLIFPEGTRSRNNSLGKFSKGGVNLAIKANKKILPIAHNTSKCWPMTNWTKKAGTIQVSIGNAINIEEKTPSLLNKEVFDSIQTQLQKLY